MWGPGTRIKRPIQKNFTMARDEWARVMGLIYDGIGIGKLNYISYIKMLRLDG